MVLALELATHIAVHLVVPLSHFFHSLPAFFSLHALFYIHLVANIIYLTSSFFLLCEQAINKIGDSDLEFMLVVSLHLLNQVTEIIIIFETCNLKTSQVLLSLLLLHVHDLHTLL